MPCLKVTKEMIAAFRAISKCKPAPSHSAIARMFGVDRGTVSKALAGRHYKLHVPGQCDRRKVAEQLREIASKIESGEYPLTA